MKLYDTIIVGAGIAGASAAYCLHNLGQKVLVLDKSGIASGGSGAAGAFVSPKIGVPSDLKNLTDEAFLYAFDFYKTYFDDCYNQTGMIRLPRDASDFTKFKYYENFFSKPYINYSQKELQDMGIKAPYGGVCFLTAGVCDTSKLCHALLCDIEVLIADVKVLEFDGRWSAEGFCGANLVLATGYESDLVDMRYMGIAGTWGNRADFASRVKLDISLHENISISSNIDGIVKIGATHELEVKHQIPCDDSKAILLKTKASHIVDTSDFVLQQIHCGMRSSSRDYKPVVGGVVDVEHMLESYPQIFNGRKYPLKHIENLFVFNGLGARGFVLAPYLANQLAHHIVSKKEIDHRVNPDRLFYNWARKQHQF